MNRNYAGNGAVATQVTENGTSNPLPAAVESLGYTINGLAALADVLANRLERVLLPNPPVDSTGTKLAEVRPMTSPLVGEIEQQRQRIERIVLGLQDVLNRLEA